MAKDKIRIYGFSYGRFRNEWGNIGYYHVAPEEITKVERHILPGQVELKGCCDQMMWFDNYADAQMAIVRNNAEKCVTLEKRSKEVIDIDEEDVPDYKEIR